MNNIGNALSINSLRKKLLQEGIKITSVTLGNYVRYFQEIFVFYWISRYDIQLPIDNMGIKYLQVWKMWEIF